MMDKFKQLLFISLSFLFLLSSHIAFATISDITSLTPQQAYEQGMILRWQDKNEQAKKFFKYAADNEVVNAMFMYGLTHYSGIFIQTETMYEYYTKAANLGHVTAMKYLLINSSLASAAEKAKWRNVLTRYFIDKVEEGDANAMYQLYFINADNTQGMKWLKKAAKAGDVKAQYALAEKYRVGKDWFLWPGKREKEIERLYKASAEQKYVLGMEGYARVLRAKGELEAALSLWQEMAEMGSAEAILTLGYIYWDDSGFSRGFEEYYNDLLAAAYISIYMQSIQHTEDTMQYHRNIYNQLLSRLSDEEKAQAEQFVQEYLATHTVRRFDNFWFMDDEALIPMDKYLPSESVK